MIDRIPPPLELPTRRELVQTHKRSQRLLNNNLDVSDGTEPDIAARVAADAQLPILAYARRVGNCAVVSTAFGEAVATWGDIYGVEPGQPAGAIGFVRISASTGGGIIQEGEVLQVKNQGVGPRYEAALTGRYTNNQLVPIRALDTGFETNQPAGVVLVWSGTIPGIHPEAVVAEIDGQGLVGGRPAASSETHKRAIIDKISDPPGAANAAHYRFEAKRAGVAIAQAFTYEAIKGPGTIGMCFVVPRASRAGTRVPDESQQRVVGEYLEGAFGVTDGLLFAVVVAQPVTLAYRVQWKASAVGWADSAPWPDYAAAGAGAVVVSSVTNALTFTLATDDGVYSGVDDPAAGNTIAFYDKSVARFVNKRVASVTGSGPWDIIVDTTNNASDESYVPVVGQRVSPWSRSLDNIADVVITIFDSMGPGEMVGGKPPDGVRRLRTPRAPEAWPHTLTQSLLEDGVNSVNVPDLFDREIVEGDGVAPAVGTPGALVYLLELDDLAIFEKP